MPTLERDETSDCTNPELDVYFRKGGNLIDPAVIEFVIYERVTNPPTLVQVYPVAGRESVDLNDCPVGHRVGLGRYVAEWTVPIAEPVGAHEIHWFFKETVAHQEQTWVQEFTVILPTVATSPEMYITVQDVRDEGIDVTELTDERAQFLIAGWSRWFDRMTGSFFYPKQLTLLLDGDGSRVIWLPWPIIELQELYINDDFVNQVLTDDFVVYNRAFPDDRKNPRIKLKRKSGTIYEWNTERRFFVGDQNQKLVGMFGYVEEDLSVPFLIQRAIMTLVLTTAELKSDSEIDQLAGGRRIEEVTDRHRVRFVNLWDELVVWNPTGFTEVDEAIRLYRRPAYVGMARKM